MASDGGNGAMEAEAGAGAVAAMGIQILGRPCISRRRPEFTLPPMHQVPKPSILP